MVASRASPQHFAAIVASLAGRSNRPVEEVAKLFEHERSKLAAVARVTTFVDVFAARNVEQILRGKDV